MFKDVILFFGICVERFGFMTCMIYSCIHVIKKIISQKFLIVQPNILYSSLPDLSAVFFTEQLDF